MALLGDFSEFPLPEILLLIGTKTGTLRLLDVAPHGIVDIDFCNGEAQAMHLADRLCSEPTEMVQTLSTALQRENGLFEFRIQPVASIHRSAPLTINHLVMSLVLCVDEQLAAQRNLSSLDYTYALVEPEPEIWVEPELNAFLDSIRPELAGGTTLRTLHGRLELDLDQLHGHMINLRLLGLVRVLEEDAPGVALAPANPPSVQTGDFRPVNQAISALQKMSSRLPMVKPKETR